MTAVHGLLGYFNPALPYSADEMRNNYDFWINHDVHTSPYIMDYFLADFFGEYTDEVREKYLEPIGMADIVFARHLIHSVKLLIILQRKKKMKRINKSLMVY